MRGSEALSDLLAIALIVQHVAIALFAAAERNWPRALYFACATGILLAVLWMSQPRPRPGTAPDCSPRPAGALLVEVLDRGDADWVIDRERAKGKGHAAG